MNARFEFFDNTERDNEVRSLKEIIVCIIEIRVFSSCENRDCNFKAKRVIIETKESQLIHLIKYEKENKSERGMPRLPEARKDVVSCEKLRGSANRN